MFEITIKEIKTEKKIVSGEYTVIDRRPYTDAELNESGYYRQSKAGLEGETKPIHGYAPDREQDVEVNREVLKQTLDTLDLSAVIKAINGL